MANCNNTKTTKGPISSTMASKLLQALTNGLYGDPNWKFHCNPHSVKFDIHFTQENNPRIHRKISKQINSNKLPVLVSDRESNTISNSDSEDIMSPFLHNQSFTQTKHGSPNRLDVIKNLQTVYPNELTTPKLPNNRNSALSNIKLDHTYAKYSPILDD